MAEKRMFSRAVVESDNFMCMPADAQALYFHLSMAADDDGFVSNPRTIMRACGASDDAMKILIARKFVLTFEKNDNFVVVIKHWRLNNYIRRDTYHETKYKEFMRELYFDENQSYSLNAGDGHTPCLQGKSVTSPSQVRDEYVTEPSRERDEPTTQNRLDKNRQDKNSIEEKREVYAPADISVDEVSELRSDTIKYWHDRLQIFKRQGFDTEGVYGMAAAYGVTRADLDNYKEE